MRKHEKSGVVCYGPNLGQQPVRLIQAPDPKHRPVRSLNSPDSTCEKKDKIILIRFNLNQKKEQIILFDRSTSAATNSCWILQFSKYLKSDLVWISDIQ